ncbi:cbb3-type cytochrome oxidase subunit 3 [Aromatoleum diolicum]|uniref:CcoQ/FixQ family Cbb3-type cytochrome c oxidase assembly chaperone n=1 Tax=Aromatoleum diolicum TaxID=75796 RepID=A0ABX1Q928_9RHOO|nr:cbb3-type cytochrome c oxidase subunit 3 [Aromatoleum diolicum]NMG74535.1 CcoQ/FixQ family Cbb3-type cytochrome c oxidase assembly chaperone [Aromatoleum diolicum]
MDINDFRSLFTVLGLTCFLGICFWAYSKSARAGFEEAALLPFTDDDAPASSGGRQGKEG